MFNSECFPYPEKEWPEVRKQFVGKEKAILKVLGNTIFSLTQSIDILEYNVGEGINVIEQLVPQPT